MNMTLRALNLRMSLPHQHRPLFARLVARMFLACLRIQPSVTPVWFILLRLPYDMLGLKLLLLTITSKQISFTMNRSGKRSRSRHHLRTAWRRAVSSHDTKRALERETHL